MQPYMTFAGLSVARPFVNVLGRQFGFYGIMMMLGLLSAAAVSCLRARKRGGDPVMVILLAAVVFAGAIVGAWLGYLFTAYEGGIAGVFRDLFAEGKGVVYVFSRTGLVFYGGLILALILALIAIRLLKLDFVVYTEALIPTIGLGHALGRVGCLLAGCCYGIPWDGPLQVVYHAVPDWPQIPPAHGRFPVQPLESVLDLILFGLLCLYTRKRRPRYAVLVAYLLGYAVIRFSDEFLRGDLERGIHGALSSSQWISLGMVAVSAVILAVMHARKGRAADA